MGIYLNPGNKGFWRAVRSEIYVDKTGLIAYTNRYLNTEEGFLCVSRPRRFGKSMTLRMLAAYYSRGCDSRELFAGFRIARDRSFEEHLNRYDVIYLNMQQFLIEAEPGKVTEYLEQEVLRELRKVYGEYLNRQGMGLAAALREIYVETDRQFIFLIDEWDCVMRVGGAAAAVSGFSAQSPEGSGVCRACLYDRDPSGEKIRKALGAEYVQRVFDDQSESARGVYRFYRD